MAAIDWAATPLGPVETWPQSLKTCVRVVLTSQQPMFVWWGPELINLYNDAYISIIGGKHPQALGQPASVVWHEIWDAVEPRVGTCMRENKGTYDEALLLIMHRHGYDEETYYTFSYSPVPDDSGVPGGILCANTDDTGRIIGQRQLALLRSLAEATSDARTLTEVFRHAAHALASNPRDLPFALLYRIDADRTQFSLEAVCGTRRGVPGVPERIAIDDDSVWPLASDELQVVDGLSHRFGRVPMGAWERPATHAAVVPIAGAGGKRPVAMLVVGLNPLRRFDEGYRSFVELIAGQIAAASTNAQAYEEEKRRAEALAEIDRAKTAFFSNISHEFRTPLTLMMGPTEDLLGGAHGPLAKPQQEQLELVHRNEIRLQKLVNSLLDFSRIEAGRIQASYEPVDLAMVTRELAGAFQSAIEKANLKLVVDAPTLDEPVYIDRDMWEKIVLNLLSNAFKFTFDGTIAVSLHRDGERAVLKVSDTGTGVPADEVPRLFERFHRVEGARSRTHEGSGIGLALVQELVRLHGGAITVDSTLGTGTAFSIAIPFGTAHLPPEHVGKARAAQSTAVAIDAYVDEASRWSGGLGLASGSIDVSSAAPRMAVSEQRATILIADDNADMREYLRKMLESQWTVIAAADGSEALAIARQHPPDLVLTDVMMPGLDGFALLRELRALETTRLIPIIMLSARAGEEARVEGLQAGADDYLVKPFSARELLARATTHLELSRLRRSIDDERRKLFVTFMQAPVAVAVLAGPEHVYELANPLYEAMFKADITGKPLRQAFPEWPADAAPFELVDRVYQTGEPAFEHEYPLVFDRRGTGRPEEGFFQFTLQPLRDLEGVTRVMAVAIDVTEQVRARRVLEASEARFRRLVNQVEAGVSQIDFEGKFFYTNERFREIVGRSEAELAQLSLLQITHADDLASCLGSFQHCIASGTPFVVEKRIIKPDGSFVWVQNSVSRVDDPDGRPASMAAITIDITQRRFAVEQLRESEDRYRLAVERLAMAQQAGEIGMFDWVIPTAQMYWSPELCRMLGVSPDFAPSAEAWEARMDPHDRATAKGEYERAVAEHRESITHQYRIVTQSGEHRWIRLSMSFRYDGAGRLDRVVGAAVDVHPLVLAVEREQVAREDAERAARFSEMFVGILGHDLRNPLNAIAMATSLIESRAGGDDRIAKPATRIASSSRRMARMIDQLLDFTRIRVGRGLPLDYRPTDLAEVARGAIDEIEMASKCAVNLVVTGDSSGTWDRDRLSQLVSNLVANACAHGTAGCDVVVRIDGAIHDQVELEVRNAGAIPRELLSDVFEPLRADRRKTRGSSGLGLGLYISQQIVLAHRGTITVESDEHHGTSFTIRLPRTATVPEHVFGDHTSSSEISIAR
jgi:PAS domain S-box-containing protein